MQTISLTAPSRPVAFSSHFSHKFVQNNLSCNWHQNTNERLLRSFRARAESGESDTDENERPKGIFSFVTDNESSRNAIQLQTNNLAEGNVGQMISEIEGKGKDLGRYIESGGFVYFIREAGPSTDKKGPIFVFLHGAPTQCFPYVPVMSQLAEKGFRCLSFDFLGFGFSEKPQPGYDFKYTEEAYHEQLSSLLATLDISEPFFLVTQGFILGSYGLTWALKNSDRISQLAILNSPLTPNSTLPNIFSQMRLPFVGEMVCQNAILTERFVEGGSPYVLENDNADVLRLPYLDSSEPGFALLEASRKFQVKDVLSRIEKGFVSGKWSVPTIVAWGEADKYLSTDEASTFASKNANVVTVSLLDGAGHLPHLDWPEKVVQALETHLERNS